MDGVSTKTCNMPVRRVQGGRESDRVCSIYTYGCRINGVNKRWCILFMSGNEVVISFYLEVDERLV